MINPSLGGAITNDAWITNNDVPDPEVLPDLPGYHVLIRPTSIREKTKGGILLPEKARDDIAYLTTVGRVLKVGTLAYEDKDKFLAGAWCREGDYVCYQKLSGTKLTFQTRVPTTSELSQCTHIHMTSDIPWNPHSVSLGQVSSNV